MQCSEAMLLGKRLGVDPQVLADIINSSTGRCWSSEVSFTSSTEKRIQVPEATAYTSKQVNHPCPEVKAGEASPPAHRDYEGGFVTKLAHKDLALAVKAAEQAGVPLAFGKTVEETFRPLAASAEYGNRDFSVIYEFLDQLKSSDVKARL